MKNDLFFSPIENTKPFLKANFYGFAGTGKTYTAAQIAVGLHKKIKSEKPIIIFDTERAAKFLKSLFKENKIEALVRESRSLADLKETMRRMREGAGDILIIDSITHVWEEYLQSYSRKVGRTRIQFQDWAIIKPTWKAEFSDPFVNDPYHIIMTGRAGYEYESEINEETQRREIYKSGVKQKVEGETAYEPDLLVMMNRFEDVLGKEKKVWREGTVIKDRSTILDGKTFKNPTYEDFAPSIEALLENPVPRNAHVLPEGDTALLFKTEEEKAELRKERDRWIEEIEGLLTRIAPSSTGKDKQLKLDLLEFIFGTTSETALRELHPQDLKEGYKQLADQIVNLGLAKLIEKNGKKILQITKNVEEKTDQKLKIPAERKTKKPSHATA